MLKCRGMTQEIRNALIKYKEFASTKGINKIERNGVLRSSVYIGCINIEATNLVRPIRRS